MGASGLSGRERVPVHPRLISFNFTGGGEPGRRLCPVVDVASPVEGKPQDSDDDSDLYTEEDKLGEEQAYNEPLSIGAGCASSQLLPLLCCAVHEGRSA